MSILRVNQLSTTDDSVLINVADIVSVGNTPSSNTAKYVGFKNSASTSTLRTVADKFEDTISVKDFGAKGDFSNDDTVGIQAALNAAGAYGKRGAVVYMPAGLYNVSATIKIPQYVTLIGAGRYSTLIRCTESGSSVSPVLDMPNSFASLRGVGVVYSSSQTSAGTCIRSNGASNTLYDYSASAGYIGVQWYNGSATKMDNFEILDCKYCGLQIGESNSGFSNDLMITNFFIIANDSTNFQIGAIRVVGRIEALFASNFDLIGSTYPITTDAGSTNGLRFSSFEKGFFDSGLNPCNFTGVNNTTFTDCWFSQRSSGAQFSGCFNLDIKGARVWNNSAQGFIFNSACHNINLSGVFGNNNTASGSGVQDIYIDGSCYMMNISNITGYEAGSTNYGVLVDSGASNITLRDIKITPRSAGVIALGSSTPGLVVHGVTGFVTASKGTSSIAASGTSVTVSHGLSITPSLANISITPNAATASNLYVSAVTATTFTVSTATSNTGVANFAWRADVSYN